VPEKQSELFEATEQIDRESAKSKNEPPRVYVLSDVRLYREGLISNLALRKRLEIVGAGGSGDFPDRISALRPDVVLLDLAAHESLTIPRRAQQVLPAVRIVAFAVADLDENLLACAEAGISGYVMQDGSSEELVAAVFSALRGELVCSPRVAGLLVGRIATLCDGLSATRLGAPLTPREKDIAALVARNLGNKEIARRLGLGPATVKNHVHSILQKLNVHRRGDVARLRLDGNRWRAASAAELPHRPG
jgi:two-component system, NarL family, nitrate/nitrite response regulator NarL